MHKRIKLCSFFLLLSFILTFNALAVELYRLGPGDQLSIIVWERDDLKTQVVVGPDGRVAVPLVGQLDVNNKTLTEVEAQIVEKLEPYILDPLVTVQIVKYRTFRVQILGEVQRPGFYNLEPGSTVLDALASAGGSLPSADLRSVQVGREQIDVLEILKNPELDKKIEAGTTVNVPAAKPILVLGAVKNPGTYSYGQTEKSLSVLDLIALAGGFTANADENSVSVERQVSGSLVRWEGTLNELNHQKVELGDIIIVTEKKQVVVSGKVVRPGAYPLTKGMGIADIIALAGGLLPDSSREITVYKDGTSFETFVDSREPLKGGESIHVGTNTNMVLVLGEVVRPGSYGSKDANTVLKAVALAGGPTELANLNEVLVGDTVVDIKKLLSDPQNDIEITTGTTIYIPSLKPVIVLGAVKNPSSVIPKEGQTLLEVIALTGGLTEKADAGKISLDRDGELIEGSLTELGIKKVRYGDVISIAEKRQVLVLGSVRNPGSYNLKEGETLIEAIASLGGLTSNADDKNISLERDGVATVGSLKELGSRELQYGDVIVVNEKQQVIIAGKVVRPGAYEVKKGLTVSDALALAGGLQPDAANTVTIIKDGHSIEVSVNSGEVLEGGESLVVGASNQRVLVLGAVARPGSFSWQEGFSVRDALALAGGQVDKSNLEEAIVIRDGVKIKVDWTKNQLLFGGDVLEIPEWHREVLVMGEISRPGSYKIDKGQRLLDVIGLAGGFTEKADNKVTIRTLDEFNVVEVKDALKDPSNDQNVILKGGEVIFIGQAEKEILVFGQVQRPGRYSYKDGDDLASIIALAGGVTAKADLTKIELQRGEEISYVDFGRYPLNGDETVIVKEIMPVTVLGEVLRPGSISISGSARVVDVIAMAGGPTKFSNLDNIKIYRGGEPTDEEKVSVGSGKLVFEGRASQNPEVYPGDVVYVYRSNKLDPSEVAAYLSILNSLSNLIRAWF